MARRNAGVHYMGVRRRIGTGGAALTKVIAGPYVARRCGDLCLLAVENFLPDGCEDIFLLLTVERVSFDEPLVD